MFFLVHTMKWWKPWITSAGSTVGRFWPSCRTLYSRKAESSQMMGRPTPVVSQPIPRKCSNLIRFFLIHNMRRMTSKKSSLLASYEASWNHVIELSKVRRMNLAHFRTTSTPVASQLRPRKWSNHFRFFQIHDKNWFHQMNQVYCPNPLESLKHLIEPSIVGKMNLANWWTTPTPVASQPRKQKLFHSLQICSNKWLEWISLNQSSLLAKYQASLDH
jgi:hypothetical protein